MSNAKRRHRRWRRDRCWDCRDYTQKLAAYKRRKKCWISVTPGDLWPGLTVEQQAKAVWDVIHAKSEPMDLAELDDPELWNKRHPEKPTKLFSEL